MTGPPAVETATATKPATAAAAPAAPAPAASALATPTETIAAKAAVGKAAAAVVAPASAAAPATAAPAVPKAPATANTSTIKYRTGRYYVIAGAYRNMSGAERGRKLLVRTGHASRIILPPYGSRLYRLTAADYPDLASAQREAQRLRIRTRCDYNTLKF